MSKPGNAYTRWLDGGRMPFPVRMPSLLRALRAEMQDLASNTDALLAKPGWTRFQAWRATEARIDALRSLVDDCAPVYRGDQAARMHAINEATAALGPLLERLGKAGLAASAKRWLVPPRTREECLSAYNKIEQWEELGRLPYPQPTALLTHAQTNRARKFAQAQASARHRLPGLETRHLDRALARRLHRQGLRASLHDLDDIIANGKVPDPVRRIAWAKSTEAPCSEEHVVEMLATRATEARTLGYASHAAYLLSECAIGEIGFLRSLITQAASSAAPALAEYYRTASSLIDKKKVARPSPWDGQRLDGAVLDRQYHRLPPLASVFPVLPTLKAVVEDLMEVGGWHSPTPPVRHGRGAAQAWHWTLTNNQGRCVHLWVAPYAATRSVDDSNVAFADVALPRWSTRRKRNQTTVFLAMKRDPEERSLAMEDLVFLAHELGHALHAFAMPGRIPEEWVAAPQDMGEFPSQLLERLALCPEKLAQWARPVAPRYRTRAHWEGALRPSTESLRILQDDFVDALLDLELHAHPAPSVPALRNIYAGLVDMAGLPPLVPEDSRHLAGFVWDGVTSKAGYCLDVMLIESLLPDNPSAADIIKTWQDTMEHVFVPGQSTPAFREAWQAWRGETLETSLERGAARLVERTLAKQRHAMAAVRGRKPARAA